MSADQLELLLSGKTDRPVLAGTVSDVIYRNASGEYVIVSLSCAEGEECTAVGCLSDVQKGEMLLLYGDWVRHPTYGLQFSVERYLKTLPEQTEDILKYLSSGVIRGVGPVTALKIVNRFGPEAFDVIEHHPSWLADIPGITRKKAAEINRAFCAQNGLRKLMMYFSDELGAVSVSRIYKEWGDKAADIIRENPYRL